MGLLSFLQIFGIGFSFGIAGPCLLACTPFFITFLAGRGLSWRQGVIYAVIFLSARLFAYLILGYLAGLSGTLLKQFSGSHLILFLKPLSGIIIIILGIFIFFGKEPASCGCRFLKNKALTFGSLFTIGFMMGVFPCAPFLALLFEITIISKTPLQGMFYAFSFGLGTFISSFIVITGLSGVITWFPGKFLKTSFSVSVFRLICALLLILLGLNLVL